MSDNGQTKSEPLSIEEFWLLIRSQQPFLHGFALKLTGNQFAAEDLVQDTIYKALASQESFIDGSNLKAWLFTIARNTHYSNYRKLRREIVVESYVFEYIGGVFESGLDEEDEQNYDIEVVLNVLASLDALLSVDSLILLQYGDYSQHEIARMLGLQLGTVKSRINRANKKLQQTFSEGLTALVDVELWLSKKILTAHTDKLPELAQLYEELLLYYQAMRKRFVPTEAGAATPKKPQLADSVGYDGPTIEELFDYD